VLEQWNPAEGPLFLNYDFHVVHEPLGTCCHGRCTSGLRAHAVPGALTVWGMGAHAMQRCPRRRLITSTS
jgi:hypothetical protein